MPKSRLHVKVEILFEAHKDPTDPNLSLQNLMSVALILRSP